MVVYFPKHCLLKEAIANNMDLSDKTLTLFLTHGSSLESWDSDGLINREMAIYRRLLEKMDGLQIFSYGTRNEKRYELLYRNLKTITWPFPRGRRYHGAAGPYFYYKALASSSVFKTNQLNGAMAAVRAKHILKKPLILRCGYLWSINSEREGDSGASLLKKKKIEKLCFETADLCVTSTKRDKDEIIEAYNIKSSKIGVIPNYVDMDIFHPAKTNKWKGSVIFVGRLSREKNLKSLLMAVEKVQKVKRLTLVGDGKERCSLEKIAAGMKTKVEFLGRKPSNELPALLAQSEVFVLPSHYEGLPKALLEAMGMGMPCLGTRVRGIDDLIRDGETGLLCSTDLDGIAAGLRTLFDNREFRSRLGTNARQVIKENYSLDYVVDLELAVIAEALKKHEE